MKIAVTGAWGQLGGELCRQLGDDALPLEIDTLDLTDGPAVHDTLAKLRPDAVINCAAYTQVDLAEEQVEAARAVNATAVEHLGAACGEIDCPLIQISTDYVFGGSPGRDTPHREDDPTSPLGIYARTKFAGECAAMTHPKHLIVRTCGLYARPDDARAKNFVKTVLRLGAERGELRVIADQHCTPSYVPHVARAVLFLAGVGQAEPAPWGIYHVTNRGETTWCEFASEIFRLAQMAVRVEPITTADYGAAAPRPAYSVLNTSAYHALGGPAMPNWQAALAEYVEVWRELEAR